MAKSEIKLLNLNIDGEVTECRVPFTLGSLLGEKLSEAVTLTATFTADAQTVSSRYVYIRIRDARGLVGVRINGVEIGENLDTGSTVSLNIKNFVKQGENSVELQFTSLPDSGILGTLELLRFGSAMIDKIFVTETFEGDSVNIGIRVEALGSIDNVRTVATLVSSSGQMYYGGLTRNRGVITVKNPLLWWPKGLGVQNLYKLTVNLYGDMEIEDTYEVRIGISTLRADRESELMLANGVAYLPMGATYLPPKRIYPETCRNREYAVINSAARVGYNTIFIPCTADFPSQDFFDLCDAHGIAVIVETRASARGDLDRRASIAESSYHPSLALVEVVGGEDKEAAIAERLSMIAPGLDFITTKEPREYCGVDSISSDRTLDEYLKPTERNLFSEKFEANGEERVANMVLAASKSYPYATSLSDFSYVSGLASADAAEALVADARMGRGRGGRAIFATLADSEFSVSPSAMDTAARWKALQYRSARFFAPIYVYGKHLGEGKLSFTVSNERRQSFVGTLEYRLLDRLNRQVSSASLECVLDGGSVSQELSADVGEYLKGHEREYYVEYTLRDGVGYVSRGVVLFVKPKHFNYVDPKIKHEIVGSDRRFSVTLTAEAFANSVELSFADCDAVFFDNYIDITSQAPVKISFTILGGIETAEHLNRALRIRSVYNVKNR